MTGEYGHPLADLTAAVRAFAEDRRKQQVRTPKNLAVVPAGEVGELLAQLQWLTPQEPAEVSRGQGKIMDSLDD